MDHHHHDDHHDMPGSGRPPRKELQGPRPAPLKVRKESHKIKKPPVAPPHQPPVHHHQPPQLPPRQPVIIYTVSPKVIHTNPSDFMTLVQRLTGPHATSSSSCSSSSVFGSSGGAISPAARLASIEMTKMPLEGKKLATSRGLVDGERMEISGGVGVGEEVEKRVFFPTGILSPGPGSLPPISPNLFSPLFREQSGVNFSHHDFSAVQHGGKSYIEGSHMPSPFSTNNNFMVSPSTMFSPSSLDLLHHILNN